MPKTRARFKHCLHTCKSIEDKAYAIANMLLLKDNMKEFTRLDKVGSDGLASTVGGVIDDDNICQMWHDHYSKLLNSNNNTTYKSYIESAIKCVSKYKVDKLCYYEVNNGINDFKLGQQWQV